MDIEVLSEEIVVRDCKCCGNQFDRLMFVRDSDGFSFYCKVCAGLDEKQETGRRELFIEEVDTEMLERKEYANLLYELAEEDEKVFGDPRLSVIKDFKDEVVGGEVSDRLHSYLKFNGNDRKLVRRLRVLALEARVRQVESDLYREIVDFYIMSRVKELTSGEENRIRLLMAEKSVQYLDPDYAQVWDDIEWIRTEAFKKSSENRYDDVFEPRKVFEFYDRKGYLVDGQVRKLKVFYFEMLRRNRTR